MPLLVRLRSKGQIKMLKSHISSVKKNSLHILLIPGQDRGHISQEVKLALTYFSKARFNDAEIMMPIVKFYTVV